MRNANELEIRNLVVSFRTNKGIVHAVRGINLTLEKGEEKKTIPVADFWSVSCMDDPENWFSVWF